MASKVQSLPQLRFGPDSAEHRFFRAMAVVTSVLVLAGFSRTYFAKAAAGSITPIIHVHAAIFTCWLVLFVMQTVFIAARRVDLHRQAGIVGAVLGLVMLVVGFLAAVDAARRGYVGVPPQPVTPEAFLLASPLRDLIVFGGLIGPALLLRRDARWHKRLMLMATVGGLAPAGMARLVQQQGLLLVPIFALLLAGSVYDLIRFRRVHTANFAGMAVSIGGWAILMPISRTVSWERVARWLMSNF